MIIQRAEPILLGDPAILVPFAAMPGSYAWSSTKQLVRFDLSFNLPFDRAWRVLAA
jgi:hypothetical protein